MPERLELLMPRKASARPDLVALPTLAQETLYVGVDVGKKAHVAGFIASTLLTRHQRFEHCPALAFENSREGFRSLIDRIKTYVPQSLRPGTAGSDGTLPPGLTPVSPRNRHSGVCDPCSEAAGGVTQNR